MQWEQVLIAVVGIAMGVALFVKANLGGTRGTTTEDPFKPGFVLQNARYADVGEEQYGAPQIFKGVGTYQHPSLPCCARREAKQCTRLFACWHVYHACPATDRHYTLTVMCPQCVR